MQLVPLELIHWPHVIQKKHRVLFSKFSWNIEPHGMNRSDVKLVTYVDPVSFPPLLLVSKYVLRHPPLYDMVISFL